MAVATTHRRDRRKPTFCGCCVGAVRRRAEHPVSLVPGQVAVLVYAGVTVVFLLGLLSMGELRYQYFTYWGWTWQLIWSVLWSVFIASDALRRTDGAESAWLFATTGFSLSYLTVVGIIITVVPAEEGTSWVMDMSESTSLGVANLGNLVAHYFPWAMATMLVIARRDAIVAFATDVDTALAPAGMAWLRPAWLWASCLVGMVALSNIWSAWFDFTTVYLTSIDEWTALLIGVGGIAIVASVLQCTAYRPLPPPKPSA